jgi:(p)ppGpp synthase/HD superfamily hydrolase
MELHNGQADGVGNLYWRHCLRTAGFLVGRWPDATPAEIEAAYLHDVLEDTGATPEGLLEAGVSEEAVTIIRLVTRGGPHAALGVGLHYLDWIRGIARAGNVKAIRVKIADNMDNSDPARLPQPPGFIDIVQRRYRPARMILESALLNG